MTLNSPFLIRRLQELEQQIAEVPSHMGPLREAWERQDRPALLCANIDAERHIRAMAITTGHIKAQVVPADGLGDVLESLSELVLRAVRMVLLAELSALRDVVSEPSARGRSSALFQGRFRSIDELTSSLDDELIRITNQLRAYRDVQDTERAAYRNALQTAHASMRELHSGSEAARFLRAGLTRTDWPTLQEVCARMLAALAIRIDVDPDLPLVVRSRPLPDVAAEQRP
jgi:hypothetical protein